MGVLKKEDQRRAAAGLAQVNRAIIQAAAARRQGHLAKAPGARPPASLAGAPVQTKVLTKPSPRGKPEPITPTGYKTAVRGLPRILAALEDGDPRLRAAQVLADTVERIGSVRGSDWQGSAIKGAPSDGGATTRVKYAERLVVIEALANGWEIGRTGRVARGAPRLALPVIRQTGKLQEIKAFQALVDMCAGGASADAILRAHGWVTKSATRKKLADGLLDALDDVADGLGFGRWNKKGLDRLGRFGGYPTHQWRHVLKSPAVIPRGFAFGRLGQCDMGRLKAPPARLASPPRAIGYANKAEAERARDKARRASGEHSLRGLYNTKRWRDPKTGVRARILARDGYQCRMCQAMLAGKAPAPTSPVVDHITPHKGNLVLFWDEANLQALCKQCHNTEKQRQERGMAQGGGFRV